VLAPPEPPGDAGAPAFAPILHADAQASGASGLCESLLQPHGTIVTANSESAK